MNEYKAKRSISIKNFFLRRLLRIFPNFYFYLLVLFILSFKGIIEISLESIFLAYFYIQNYNLWQNTDAFATSWFVQHSWSLSVEEQFYLIYPFVFKAYMNVVKNNHFILTILIILICTFFRALNYSFPEISRWLGGPFFMHADFLFIGCIMRFTIDRYKLGLQKAFYHYKEIILLSAFGLVVISSVLEYRSGINIIIFGNLILLGNALIFSYFLLFPVSSLGLLFESKILSFIGKLSYSLYVWQQLFLGSTSSWV